MTQDEFDQLTQYRAEELAKAIGLDPDSHASDTILHHFMLFADMFAIWVRDDPAGRENFQNPIS